MFDDDDLPDDVKKEFGSTWNTTEYKNSELCQTCAKCCQQTWWWTDKYDDYLRYSWLDSDLVKVEALDDSYWRIRLLIPCKQLEKDYDGKYSCRVHDRVRPSYCKTYPNNMLNCGLKKEYQEEEAEFCPALKELLEKGEATNGS